YLSNCKVDVQNEIIDIESNAQQLTLSRKQLRNAMDKLVKGNQDIIQYQDELNKKEKELTDAKLELSRKTTELEKTEKVERIRLTDAKETLEEGEKSYQSSQEVLDDVGAQIEWYAFDRSENPGWSSYGDDADRVDRIARIFPVFFLLVASLVCLTTVTRMVEEQRTEIGTCKALGYSGAAITAQYLLYTVLASVLGTAVGTVIGDQLFPRVLFRCYQMMYHYPQIDCPYHWGYALICLAAALICTGVTAAAVCTSVVQEMPARLMRPKAPKSGKRVLLEKWHWLWHKLSFHTKVTIRNFFRYRARVLMSVIGICGCTALLLTGFGLYHAIAAIVDLQYQEVLVYDAAGIYDGSTENREILRDRLEHTDAVAGYQFGAVRSCTVRTGKRSYEVTVTVPEDAETFSDYIVLRDRKTKEPCTLADSGIILNEKLAALLNITVGDNVTLEDAARPAAVTGIAENYALNRVWMTKSCYESLFGSMESNCVFINEQPDTDEDALAEHLLRSDALLRLDFNSDSGENLRKLVKALGYVVAVVIVFAGLLALAVLYNLAYINILERQRELATVKVLGFYDKEVYAYVLRENILSSVLGIAAGLVAGIFLCRYVVKTAEVDVVMFAPDIPWYCFVLAAAVTMVFTLLVNLLLRRKLRAIDMASSIKAVE
ncbi:MAG: FtsX-like permease family protein, partial [Oscillospiraceae bacterium]|nr:FtsX-like permease family protein [Oscillospiraceae bacterium]